MKNSNTTKSSSTFSSPFQTVSKLFYANFKTNWQNLKLNNETEIIHASKFFYNSPDKFNLPHEQQ